MEWDNDIDLSRRKFSSRLIVQRALARHWRIRGFETNPAIFLLYPPDRDKPIKIFSASPSQMPYPAAKIAKDKYITNLILADENIPVPAEYLITDSANFDMDKAMAFLDQHKRVVVKPLDASHGNGITVNTDSLAMLKQATDEARDASENGMVLLQEQIEGFDIRIVCIDYKFVDSVTRIPASITGDGTNTIRELIVLTNESEDRGEGYKVKLNVIPIPKVEQFLGREALERVPEDGEDVQVIGVSNVGQGGVRKNIGKTIPQFLKDIAIKAAKTLELPVCGVDFLVTSMPTPDSDEKSFDYRVIEVNECPMLTMYDDLDSPEQAAVVDAYLDFVAQY